MLDRYLLRYFLAVVDQGNFSRAARACHVAQPTLSVGIAKLERAVGGALFARTSQRTELTEAGTRLLAHARRIEQAFDDAAQAMVPSGEKPVLRLGVLASIPIAPVAAAIAEARPNATHRFELIFGTERELTGRLGKGRIDIALSLVDRGATRFLERAVLREGYAVAMPAGHPLAGAAAVSAEQIAGETMIVRRHCETLPEISRFFIERHVRPHLALRSTGDERVLAMVAAGLGITVMPQSHRHPGVALPRLAGFAFTRTLGWLAAPGGEHLLDDPPFVVRALSDALATAAAATDVMA